MLLLSREWATHSHVYFAKQVSLSPDLRDQPAKQLKERLFSRYFLQKFVHKNVAHGFW
jgi:abortive infection bacteriophage resistance protein